MKRLALGLLAVVLMAASPGVQSAHAYYDDVHFALTYYMARQGGFTPVQAYRIASACSSVDWDPDTEPVQKIGQALVLFTPLEGSAQRPRWKFHAMRKELHYIELHFGDVLGNTDEAAAADGEILQQREALFAQAVDTTKNPGVFLHFFQDEVPHHGYGAAWGHWPMLPGCVEVYEKQKRVIGGTSDWISFRKEDVRLLTERCSPWFQKFMDKVSPHQYWRPYYEKEYTQLVEDLAKPAYPKPIDSELKREQYVQYYAKCFGWGNEGWGNLVDPKDLAELGGQLHAGMSDVDMVKHRDGPELKTALAAVDRALKAAGMPDVIPAEPIKFDLNSSGDLENEFMRDEWVLVGSLEVTVKASAPVKATLRMTVRDREGKPKEMDLPGLDPVTIDPGAPYRWNDLPLGDLVLVLTKKDGSTVRQEVSLRGQQTILPAITLKDEAAAAAGDLKFAMEFDESSGTALKVSAVNPPETSGQIQAAYDKFTQATKGKWILLTLSGGGRTRFKWQLLQDLGVGPSMLAVLTGELDLPPGTHQVTAKASLLGQSLSASKEIVVPADRNADVFRKRLTDSLAALEEAKKRTEGGREECRKSIRSREEEKAALQKSLEDKDTTAEARASIEEKIAALDKEIAGWRATLKLLDPSDGEAPGWIDRLKSTMAEQYGFLASARSNLGDYGEALKALDEAKNWGYEPKALCGLRLACARRNFDLQTWEEMSKKAGFEPDYLAMAEIVLLRKNDLGAARSYVAKWKSLKGTDDNPGIDLPPEDAEFAN